MSINPIDNYFRFDYVCLSFLTVFETKIKTYINEYREKIESILPKLNDNKFLIPSPEPKPQTFYDEMTDLTTNSIPIEYYLTQIKENCFDVIGNLNLESEIEKIKTTCEGLIAFSEDIVSVKHFLYDNNTQYFGEARDTEDIKEGFGCLIYKEREQVYLGTFKEDKFVNGIIIQNNNNRIYKGEFNTEKNLFYGLKIRHNDKKKVENFFFGQIETEKAIYTGCSVKYNLREELTDKDYLANINYYHNNDITLSLQYFPKDKRKIFLVNSEKDSILQYYTGVYLINSPSKKNKEKEKSKAILFKIKDVFNEYVDERIKDVLKDILSQYYMDDTPEGHRETYLRLLYNVPSGIELTAHIVTNYGQLKTMWHQRHNHRLPEWRKFCDWILTLPSFSELTGIEKEKKNADN